MAAFPLLIFFLPFSPAFITLSLLVFFYADCLICCILRCKSLKRRFCSINEPSAFSPFFLSVQVCCLSLSFRLPPYYVRSRFIFVFNYCPMTCHNFEHRMLTTTIGNCELGDEEQQANILRSWRRKTLPDMTDGCVNSPRG